MSAQQDDKPMLANLVRSGEQQTEAEAITDFIHMAKDISNLYLVNTNDGDVQINAGFMGSTERNTKLLNAVRTGPLKALILTQAHADHYGGVPAFMQDNPQILTGPGFTDTCDYFSMLDQYLRRRSGKLWSSTIKGRDLKVPKVTPTKQVEDTYSFDVGERQFQILSTPGGESPDAIAVWMPKERIVFTGNLFGPVFLSMPNLCTMRGDKPRSARRYLQSLEKVRELNPELLITGHGEPIQGAEKIQADLTKMHDAVLYVHDETVKGMNDGKDVHTLMRDIQLPEPLKIGEFHGKVSWAVRTIWEEYSGWFHQDYTTSMYATPRSAIDSDLVELSGGVSPLASRAQHKLNDGKPLQALHLLEIALGAEPTNQDALATKKQALEELLKQSGGSNLSEVMWLKTEIATIEKILEV